MSTANATSGASVPAPGLNPGQLVSAIDHLWMAARLIDTLRTELHVLPDEALEGRTPGDGAACDSGE